MQSVCYEAEGTKYIIFRYCDSSYGIKPEVLMQSIIPLGRRFTKARERLWNLLTLSQQLVVHHYPYLL